MQAFCLHMIPDTSLSHNPNKQNGAGIACLSAAVTVAVCMHAAAVAVRTMQQAPTPPLGLVLWFMHFRRNTTNILYLYAAFFLHMVTI